MPKIMRSPELNQLLPPGLIDRADYKTIDWEKDLTPFCARSPR
ncbi:MAG: hypothetical protein QW797_09195 [Thermoproteota archaeon]